MNTFTIRVTRVLSKLAQCLVATNSYTLFSQITITTTSTPTTIMTSLATTCCELHCLIINLEDVHDVFT